MKICTNCKASKPKASFSSRQGRCKPCQSKLSKIWREENKEELKAKKVEHRRKNPDQWRNRNLENNYGISLETYEEMLEAQRGTCAVCRKPETARSKRYKRLCVDHCHESGLIRGLLCNKCNRSLGLMEDDVASVEMLFRYLKHHKIAVQPAA